MKNPILTQLKKTTVFLLLFFFQITNLFSQTQGGTWTWKSGDAGAGVAVYGTQGVPSASNKPPGLVSAISWTDLTGRFWLYGGVDGAFYQVQADLWMFDPSTQMWTWMKGPGAISAALDPVYGTQGVSSPANTPGSRRMSCTWTDNSGNLWLFGGIEYFNQSNSYNDLWKYNISTNEWTWMKGSNSTGDPGTYGTIGVSNAANNPSARTQSNATWTDNSGNLWLFGGTRNMTSNSTSNLLNDLWKYDVSTNNWTWMNGSNTPGDYGSWGTMGVPDPNNRPGYRSTSFRWKDNAGNLWLYGGLGNTFYGATYYYSSDLWKYNISTNMWTWVNGSTPGYIAGSMATSCSENNTNRPSARYDAGAGGACMVDACGNFWLYGGDIGMGWSDDRAIWRYNPSTNEWAWVGNLSGTPNYGTLGVSNTSNNPPAPRQLFSGWFDLNGNLWTGFGYDNISWNYRNDLWKFTPDYCLCVNCTATCMALSLPIELLYFKAECVSNAIELSWSTASQINNNFFTIERSNDGLDFNPIQIINGAGNSTQILKYNFTDNSTSPEQIYYYRLKQTDYNGEYNLSNLLSIENCNQKDQIISFSNPTDGPIKIKFSEFISSAFFTVINNLGQVILSGELSSNNNTIDLTQFSNGLYYLTINISEKEINRKIIVQH